MEAMEYFPGMRLLVFDNTLFKDDITTPLSMTMKPATVMCWYGYRDKQYGIYPNMVDVLFDHKPDRVSKGHFVWATKELQGDL